jgi:hypothetical protein
MNYDCYVQICICMSMLDIVKSTSIINKLCHDAMITCK